MDDFQKARREEERDERLRGIAEHLGKGMTSAEKKKLKKRIRAGLAKDQQQTWDEAMDTDSIAARTRKINRSLRLM
jgi:hypothetical protein